MFSVIVAYAFVLAFLALGWCGFWLLRTGHLPWDSEKQQTAKWGDKELTVTHPGIFLMIIGLVAALVIWVLWARTTPKATPSGPAPTPNIAAAQANSPVTTGPWRAESNGVVLTVAPTEYGADDLAQVRFRIDNTSTATIETLKDQRYFSVVDNLGRARDANSAASSLPAQLTLYPGQSTFARAQVALPWSKASEYFDVRLNLAFRGNPQFFTVSSPGVPIPQGHRVGP